MPAIRANGIQIEYDTFGNPSSPPLLLIMGLGGQMIFWDKDFCRQIAGRNLFVIRFDNRDVGLSSKIEDTGMTDPLELLEAAWRGEEYEAPYTLDDMADDAIGLLDGLGIDKAHILGSSMGGMIAQNIAVRYPGRLLTLISMSSSTGNPGVAAEISGTINPQSVSVQNEPCEREANIEFTVTGMRTLSSPGFPFDEERVRRGAAAVYDRCYYPRGKTRQLLAIIASGNRRPGLAGITAPTLVIHGDSDPLVPVEYGIDTADAVPGAELLIIEGMGHDLPRPAWPGIMDVILDHTHKAKI